MNRIITFFLLSCIGTALIVSCQKEYSLELNKVVVDTAKGSLKDSVTGNCLPSVVHGTYYNGVATSDTNYLELTVNVTALGAYQINTGVQNGFSFSDSGSFTKLGYDTIRLKASGTPTLHVVTDFTISFDSSVCSFSVNVKDSTGTGLGGNTGGNDTSVNKSDSAWQFSDGTNFFHGSVDSTSIIDTTINGQAYKAVTIDGRLPGSANASDTIFYLGIAFPGGTITTGTYVSTSLAQFGMVDAAGNIYQADLTTTGYLITVIVTAYDAGTGIMEGTFTGTAKTASGGTVTISGGKFKAKIT